MSEHVRTAALRWTGSGLAFEGTSGSAGPDRVVAMDGDGGTGPSPMELLLLSLGGCMAIDVRVILERSRVALTAMELRLEGDRRPADPRSFEAVRMHFRLEGPTDTDRAKVERAIRLSEEKYCSVHHTLRPDLEIRTSFELA
jgi:putative redox protein